RGAGQGADLRWFAAHHGGARSSARHAAQAAASGDAVRHRDTVEDADRWGVGRGRGLAGSVRICPGSRCDTTHHRYAEAHHRGAPVPQRPGAGRPAEGSGAVVRHRRGRAFRAAARDHVAGLADRGRRRVHAVGCCRGAVVAEHRCGRGGYVRHRRRRRRTAPARKRPGRRPEGNGHHRRQARQRRVPGQGARRGGRQDPRPPAGGHRGGRTHHRAPGRAQM
ncbi:transcriptional repressor, partial [Mycolicibacterium brisbanense]